MLGTRSGGHRHAARLYPRQPSPLRRQAHVSTMQVLRRLATMPHEPLTASDVAHLADLARIQLPPDSLDHYAGQLDAILVAVSRVAEVAAADVPPMSHPQDIANVTRPDVVVPGLSREAALAGAPDVEDDRFRVPQILGEPA